MFDLMKVIVLIGGSIVAVACAGCSASVSFDFIDQNDGGRVVHEVTHHTGKRPNSGGETASYSVK